MKKVMLIILAGFILALTISTAVAQEDKICAIYFTGVGCPHCAKTDPVVIKELTDEYNNLAIIEYEIYQTRGNAPLLLNYSFKYKTGEGIPLVIFSPSDYIIGDEPIIKNAKEKLNELNNGNDCLTLNGAIPFESLNLNTLPGYPKIWANGRVLIKTGKDNLPSNDTLMKNLLFSNNLSEIISSNNLENIKPFPVHLSGQDVYFTNAVKIGNWVMEYGMKENSGEEKNTGYLYLLAIVIVLFVIIILLYKVVKK
ncbi:hypothetical protein J7L48_03630 [bacterium]|nr:hypothetical protein [bacterium]